MLGLGVQDFKGAKFRELALFKKNMRLELHSARTTKSPWLSTPQIKFTSREYCGNTEYEYLLA